MTKSENKKPRVYRRKFLDVIERVRADPQNVFGQQLVDFMEKNNLSISFLQKRLGLHGERVYHLFYRTDRELLMEAEIIYRLARFMKVSPTRLYTTYLLSHGQYEFSTLRGKFQVTHFTPEQLSALGASFDLVWNILIQSERFSQASPEQQAQQAQYFADLWDLFLAIPAERQGLLLQMASSLEAEEPTPDISATQRSHSRARKSIRSAGIASQ